MDDIMAARHNVMRRNVLDFTVDELVRLCWNNRLIDFFNFKNKQMYSLRNHHELGMRLVSHCPE